MDKDPVQRLLPRNEFYDKSTDKKYKPFGNFYSKMLPVFG